MLTDTASHINLVLEVGPDGAVLVDAGPATASGALIAAMRQVTQALLRYLVDTSAEAELVGGNARISQAGYSF